MADLMADRKAASAWLSDVTPNPDDSLVSPSQKPGFCALERAFGNVDAEMHGDVFQLDVARIFDAERLQQLAGL
jgi:hypothetical protein